MPLFSRTPSPHPPSAPTSDLAASNQRVFRLARHSRATSDGFVEHRTSGATTTGTAEEMTAALRRSEGDERLGRPLSGAVVVTPTGGVAPSVDSSKGPGPDKRASGSSFGSRSTTKGGRRLLGSLFSRKDDGPQPGRLEAEAALEGRRGQDKAADVVDKADGSDKVVLERPHSVADTRLRRPSSSFTPTRIGPGVGRPPTPSSPAPHPNRLSRSSSASQIYDPALLTRSILPRFFSPSSSSSVSTEGPIADRRASSALGTYEASGLVEGHHALGAQDPPTDSLKALSQLSGLPLRALVDGGAKGIERLTGIRVASLDSPRADALDLDLGYHDKELVRSYRPLDASSPALIVDDGDQRGGNEEEGRRSNSTEKTVNAGLGIAVTTDAPAPSERAPSPAVLHHPRRQPTRLPDHYRPSDPTTYRRSVATEGGYAAESERSFSRPTTQFDPDRLRADSSTAPPLPAGSEAEDEMFRRRKGSASSADNALGPLPIFRRPMRKVSATSTASDSSSFAGAIHIRNRSARLTPEPDSTADELAHPRSRRGTLNSFSTASDASLRTAEGTVTGTDPRSRMMSDVPSTADGEGLNQVNGRAWGQRDRPSTGRKGTAVKAVADSHEDDVSGLDGDAATLASLYMVCGLPKDPACWTLAQPEHLPAHLEGAVPRFWRPEVLGTTVSGQGADLLGTDFSSPTRRKNRSRTSTQNTGQSTARPGRGGKGTGLGKEELAKMQAKSMKLAFPREVEVIASTVQPPSTTHCFSFVVPPAAAIVTDAMGAIGQEWDLALATSSGTDTTGPSQTWYGACLTVWSHADRSRSEAIRRTAEEGSKAKSAAIARAVKAAAAGRKFGAKLQAASRSPMGILPTPEGLAGRKWSAATSASGTETEDTEAFVSESEFEGPASRLPIAQVPVGTPFWLPYSLVLVSKLPIYDLMTDHLRISWARYHQAIGKHSQQMLKMLNAPAPRPGERIKLPVGAGDSQTFFVAKAPGGPIGQDVDFTMWPVFRCLSLEHIISIYEIGFSPMGRILFFSRYPVLLNMAVETFRHLLELRGWRGMCQSVVHARDVKIYLEDPGPYIIGMNAQVRPLASNPPPEVMVVDLDTDSISCPKPYPHALSKGALRFKIERRLHEAIGYLTGARGVPSEFHEAFPGGRFRPFSQVEIKGIPSLAERLVPPPEWEWEQGKVVAAFDAIVAELPRGAIAKMFKRRSYRQAPVLDPSAKHVQDIVRRHATGFVDRRDMLETKIWKLNRRLTFLMSESMEWKSHFETFQKFTDRLSIESQDLKTRLENERRSHKRLSGVVNEQQAKQVELEHRLLETEHAWMAAQVELAKAHELRDELERQKDIMVSEMKSIALAGDGSMFVDDVSPRMDAIDEMPSRPGTAASNHASLTTRNLRRISNRARPLSVGSVSPRRSGSDEWSEREPSEAGSDPSERAKEEEQIKNRAAVIDTMRGIQARLESTLRSAGLLDEEELRGYDVGTPTNARSRRSADSRDSKLITLQRGRRKPNHSVDLTAGTTSSSSQESASAAPSPPLKYSPLLNGPRQFAKPSGVALNRTRADPRMSAISLLTPGQSIFEGRPAQPRQSFTPTMRSPMLAEMDDEAASGADDGTDAASFFSAVSVTPTHSPELVPVELDDPVVDIAKETFTPSHVRTESIQSDDSSNIRPRVPGAFGLGPGPTARSHLRPLTSSEHDRHSTVSIASSQATVRKPKAYPGRV